MNIFSFFKTATPIGLLLVLVVGKVNAGLRAADRQLEDCPLIDVHGDCVEACAPGFYNVIYMDIDGPDCVKSCPPGTLQVSDSECVECPSGTVSDSPGRTTCDECGEPGTTHNHMKTECVCDVGHGGAECTECPLGYYKNSTGSGDCISCPTGTTTSLTGSDDALYCDMCAAGTYVSGGTCKPCPQGMYSASPNSTTCEPCPTGTTTNGTGATECICAPGYGGPSCTACTSGTFKASVGSGTCTPCNSGKVNIGAGATECVCPAGTYEDMSGSCSQCEVGTYSASGGSQACTSCDPGKTTIGTGSNSASDCLCPAGTFYDYETCEQCLPGYYCPPDSAYPIPCQEGTASDEFGRTRSCYACPDYTIPNDMRTKCVCADGFRQKTDGSCAPLLCRSRRFVDGSTCQACPDSAKELVDGLEYAILIRQGARRRGRRRGRPAGQDCYFRLQPDGKMVCDKFNEIHNSCLTSAHYFKLHTVGADRYTLSDTNNDRYLDHGFYSSDHLLINGEVASGYRLHFKSGLTTTTRGSFTANDQGGGWHYLKLDGFSDANGNQVDGWFGLDDWLWRGSSGFFGTLVTKSIAPLHSRQVMFLKKEECAEKMGLCDWY